MIIECPKCNKEKKLNFTNGLLCEHCKTDMSGYKYRKAAIVAVSSLIIGASAGHTIEKYVFSNTRYPLDVESAILEYCRSGHNSLISQEQYKVMSDRCICVLSRTQKEVSYSSYKTNKNYFLQVMEKNLSSCKE